MGDVCWTGPKSSLLIWQLDGSPEIELDRFISCQSHTLSFKPAQVLLFSKLNKKFFGYFDPEYKFIDNENKSLSG